MNHPKQNFLLPVLFPEYRCGIPGFNFPSMQVIDMSISENTEWSVNDFLINEIVIDDRQLINQGTSCSCHYSDHFLKMSKIPYARL